MAARIQKEVGEAFGAFLRLVSYRPLAFSSVLHAASRSSPFLRTNTRNSCDTSAQARNKALDSRRESKMAALQPQALLVVTDTTQGMEFGIDAHVWTLGAKFEGLHSISAGLHLLTFAPGGVAGREGVFIDCVGGGVHRQRWDVQNECLGACSLNDAQSESLEAAARAGALTLAPYPQNHARVWAAVASIIDVATLQRCNLRLDEAFGPGGIDGERGEREPRWTPVDRDAMRRRRGDVDATSFHGPDASLRLAATAAPSMLMKELALAFVVFLALGSLEALKQWQRLVRLFCACDDRMAAEPLLFQRLASLLTAQLALAPEDFFRDALGRDEDVLRAALLDFFANAADKPMLATAADGLLAFARERFGLWEQTRPRRRSWRRGRTRMATTARGKFGRRRSSGPARTSGGRAARLVEAGGEGGAARPCTPGGAGEA